MIENSIHPDESRKYPYITGLSDSHPNISVITYRLQIALINNILPFLIKIEKKTWQSLNMQNMQNQCIINNCWRSVPLPCWQYMAIFNSVEPNCSCCFEKLIIQSQSSVVRGGWHCVTITILAFQKCGIGELVKLWNVTTKGYIQFPKRNCSMVCVGHFFIFNNLFFYA